MIGQALSIPSSVHSRRDFLSLLADFKVMGDKKKKSFFVKNYCETNRLGYFFFFFF